MKVIKSKLLKKKTAQWLTISGLVCGVMRFLYYLVYFSVWGLICWRWKVQPKQGELLKIQAEKTRLEIIELQEKWRTMEYKEVLLS
jgi:hypothetical protein